MRKFLSLMMIALFSVLVSAMEITMPASTLDLQNPTMVTTAGWTGESAYYLDDDVLVLSGQESRQSVAKQTWITILSTGSSNSTWDALAPFKGSDYYTNKAYATLQAGRYTAYLVTGCDSVWVYGYNNAATKYLAMNIYDVTGSEAASIDDASVTATYAVDMSALGKQATGVIKQALDATKTYLVVTTGTGNSNSRVFEVAFFRHPASQGGEDPVTPEDPEEPTTKTVYCKMTYDWWTADGAAVAVHYWGGATSTEWPGVRMEAVTGEEGLWKYDIPADAANFCFVRVNGSGDIADWGAKTVDLAFQTDGNDLFTITSDTEHWGDNKCEGTWTKYQASQGGEEPGEDPVVEPVDSVTLYFVNVPAWEAVNAYAWQEGVGQNAEWPGLAMTKLANQINEKDVYSFTFPASMEHIIFNNGNGAQTTDAVALWNAAKPYFYDGAWYELDSIPVAGEEPIEEPTLANGYYLIGQTGWDVAALNANLLFAPAEAEGEYKLTVALTAGQGIKVVYVNNGAIVAWYPDGEGNEYVVDAAHAGDAKDIYFRPAGNADWAEFGGYIWTGAAEIPPVIDATQPYTLTFNYYNSISGDKSAGETTFAGLFTEASLAYINVEADSVISKVYLGRKYEDDQSGDSIFSNVKFGTASVAGELKFALKNMNVDSVIFRAAKYGDSEGGDGFSVNGTAFTLSRGNKKFENVKYIPQGEIAYLDIVQTTANKGRFYLTSITVYPHVEGQGGEEPIVEPVDSVTLYFVNVPAWEAVNAYAWAEGVGQNAEWPGVALTPMEAQINEKDVYSYSFPVTFDRIIFNNGNGGEGNQTADEVALWNAAKPYFYDGAWYELDSIPAAGEEPIADPTAAVIGTMTEWQESIPFELAEDKLSASFSDTIPEGSYEVKMIINGEWRSNGGTIDREHPYAIVPGNETANMTFVSDTKGLYTFTWFFANDSFYVEYPEYVEPIVEPVDSVTLYFVNVPAWEAVKAFVWLEGTGLYKEWPGEAMTKLADQINEKDVYSYTFPASYTSIIFNNGNGGEGNQTADEVALWNAAKPYFYDGAWYELDSIPAAGEEPIVEPEINYYLVGNITNWEVVADDAHKFVANPGVEGEYMLSFTLAKADQIKVVKVEGENQTWYPEDYDGAYTIDAAHAGTVTIYFRPEGGVEGWHYGLIYVAPAEDPQPQPEPQMKTIYCKAPSWWLADGAAIGVFTWNDNGVNKTEWPGERMALVENETDVYSFELDMNTYHMCIFTRVNGEGEIEGWGAKTGDLIIPTDDNDLFTITNAEGCWDSEECVCTGAWSKYEASEPQPIDNWAEIVWTEVVAGADLAEDATFNLLGSDFSATIHDAGDKMSIDENSSRFGTAEGYKMYTHRLKSNGASSSTKNFITLNIPSAGKLRIAARTGSNSATDRALVITQGEDELYNAIVQESQAVKVDEGEPAYQVNVYPYVTVDVAVGEVRVSYTAGMNFYGFAFEASAEPEPEPQPTHTYTVAGNLASVFDVAWDPAVEANDMIEQLDGTYKWEKTELELREGTEIAFKVVMDYEWANGNWPTGDNYTVNIAEDGIYTLTITFNAETKEVAGVATKTGEAVIPVPDPVFYIAGSMTDWAAGKVEMVADAEAENTYRVSIALEADSTYYFKVIKAVGEDLTWYGAGIPVTMVYGNSTDWELAGDANVGLQATKAGNYEFIFVNSDPMLISVVIPEPDPEQPVDSMTVYFVNEPAWENVMAYVWNNTTMENFGEWPGNEMTLTETVFNEMTVYSFTFPTTFDKVIFNNGGSGEGNQTSDMLWNEATPYFYDGIWYASLEDINPEAQTAFYISGNGNLVGYGSIWDPTAIKSLESSYTLHLEQGVYALKISLDGTTETWKGFSDLTNVAEGLNGDEDNNAILFTLAEAGDVIVTYSVVDGEVTFTVTGNFFTIEDGFYLFGLNAHSLYELTAADKLAANGDVEGEYTINATLASGDMIQVGEVENNAVMWWFGSIYTVDAAHAGEKTIYFRPDYNPEWAEDFGGYIYIEANSPTSIDNTAADAKAVKMIQNGMILIIKGDKTYNIMGQIVK